MLSLSRGRGRLPLLLCVVAAVAVSTVTADLLDRGRKALEHGRVDEAIALLERNLKSQPDVQSKYWLARAYYTKAGSLSDTGLERGQALSRALAVLPGHGGNDPGDDPDVPPSWLEPLRQLWNEIGVMAADAVVEGPGYPGEGREPSLNRALWLCDVRLKVLGDRPELHYVEAKACRAMAGLESSKSGKKRQLLAAAQGHLERALQLSPSADLRGKTLALLGKVRAERQALETATVPNSGQGSPSAQGGPPLPGAASTTPGAVFDALDHSDGVWLVDQRFWFADGAYHLKGAWPTWRYYFRDGLAQLDTEHVSGPLDQGYGIAFRMAQRGGSEWPSGYWVLIAPMNGWKVVKATGGAVWALTDLTPWRHCDALDTGAGARNRVGVVCDGAKMTVVINGVAVGVVEDNKYPSGGVGPVSCSYQTHIAFRNLRIDPVYRLPVVPREVWVTNGCGSPITVHVSWYNETDGWQEGTATVLPGATSFLADRGAAIRATTIKHWAESNEGCWRLTERDMPVDISAGGPGPFVLSYHPGARAQAPPGKRQIAAYNKTKGTATLHLSWRTEGQGWQEAVWSMEPGRSMVLQCDSRTVSTTAIKWWAEGAGRTWRREDKGNEVDIHACGATQYLITLTE
jgi:hypothetical protein